MHQSCGRTHPALHHRRRSPGPGWPTSGCVERWTLPSRWLCWCRPGWRRGPPGPALLRSQRRVWRCCRASCRSPRPLGPTRPQDHLCPRSPGTAHKCWTRFYLLNCAFIYIFTFIFFMQFNRSLLSLWHLRSDFLFLQPQPLGGSVWHHMLRIRCFALYCWWKSWAALLIRHEDTWWSWWLDNSVRVGCLQCWGVVFLNPCVRYRAEQRNTVITAAICTRVHNIGGAHQIWSIIMV